MAETTELKVFLTKCFEESLSISGGAAAISGKMGLGVYHEQQPWQQNTARKVGWYHSAGTSLDVSSDILRKLQRILLSGALQACSTPRLFGNLLDTEGGTHTQRRKAAPTDKS